MISSIKFFRFVSVCLESSQSSEHNRGLMFAEKKKSRIKLLKIQLLFLQKFQHRLNMHSECLQTSSVNSGIKNSFHSCSGPIKVPLFRQL